ncbi:MAG: helix-turn-helix domain-containing protein [Actinobacteria bacterium]|nr:helix-turn-helix domain-containing protein [Actinomycetota bacterium]
MLLTKINTGKDLMEFRIQNGVSQEKLSENTGVSVHTIIGIEKETREPQAVTIYKLNQYLSTFN